MNHKGMRTEIAEVNDEEVLIRSIQYEINLSNL